MRKRDTQRTTGAKAGHHGGRGATNAEHPAELPLEAAGMGGWFAPPPASPANPCCRRRPCPPPRAASDMGDAAGRGLGPERQRQRQHGRDPRCACSVITAFPPPWPPGARCSGYPRQPARRESHPTPPPARPGDGGPPSRGALAGAPGHSWQRPRRGKLAPARRGAACHGRGRREAAEPARGRTAGIRPALRLGAALPWAVGAALEGLAVCGRRARIASRPNSQPGRRGRPRGARPREPRAR